MWIQSNKNKIQKYTSETNTHSCQMNVKYKKKLTDNSINTDR